MNQKIEHSLRRAVGQLPRPDYQAVAQAPVQRMEVHDYVTRQEMVVRPSRPRLLAAAVLAVCVLALCVGLTVYFQFFQIYSVVDLRVNPAFAIQLNRQDQVRGVQALNDDAGPILEGRSYKDWALEAVVSALVDDLIVNGYLDAEGDKVDVAVNSQSAEHSRELRSYVEGLLDQRLAGLSNTGTQEDPANSTPAPEETTAAVQTPAPVVTPPPTPAPAPPADPVLSWGEDGLLTREAVEAIVQAQSPGAQISELKLDRDDGRLIYELKYWDSSWVEYEMDLDAYTGTILKWERD